MRTHPSFQLRAHTWRSGLSLVEMLTTIAVLGVLTSIVVPQLSALSGGQTNEVRHRRNAQEIASVCVTADAAGLDLVDPASLEKTIRKVIAGGKPNGGPFHGKVFAVRGLVEEDVIGVQKYLSLSNGQLNYHSKPKS